MNCPCGGQTRQSVHTLITLPGAREWLPGATPEHLPLRVEVDRCIACGRQRVSLFRGERRIERRG